MQRHLCFVNHGELIYLELGIRKLLFALSFKELLIISLEITWLVYA